MRKLIRRASRKAGLPPGSLVHVGERAVAEAQISVLDYAADHLEEAAPASVEQCLVFKDKPTVTWINITGLHDVDLLQQIGDCYGIHPLVLEDILNTQQRPKIEDFDDYLFVVLKMIDLDPETKEITAEQITFIVGDNFVLSFQEAPGDVFENVRARLRNGRRRIRERGADYLAYTLLDAVVDHYFVVLEALGNHIEELEDELVEHPTGETLHAIYVLKRELIFLRRSVWPLREVLSFLSRGESRLVQQETLAYLRDVYDHTIQVADTIESFRDVIGGMHDTYLSSVSNRMNEVMKVLTIFASIFIPLTFLAGVYGMNFDHMPELHWRWSYPALLSFMFVATLGMLVYFRRRRWL
ncbi:MAG TPA: magnesium/cobalt transporter CorA [Armatimonadota bacterium]|nr:magnesium/cobalt transporter CorA [Armatimonadota bacterium]